MFVGCENLFADVNRTKKFAPPQACHSFRRAAEQVSRFPVGQKFWDIDHAHAGRSPFGSVDLSPLDATSVVESGDCASGELPDKHSHAMVSE